MRGLREFGEAYRCVDVVAENGFAGGCVAAEHGRDAFAEELFAEFRITRGAGMNCVFEAAGQCHCLLSSCFLCVWNPASRSQNEPRNNHKITCDLAKLSVY